MDKSEIIKLLQSEDWTKADALRAVESIDFSTAPDELTIRRNISRQFVGSELIKRQRQQSSQKSLVTKKTSEIEQLKQKYQADIKQRDLQIEQLLTRVKELDIDNRSLTKVNDELKKDNKSLKNIVDAIRLQIAKDMKGILKHQDIDLRQAILKLFKSTQG